MRVIAPENPALPIIKYKFYYKINRIHMFV